MLSGAVCSRKMHVDMGVLVVSRGDKLTAAVSTVSVSFAQGGACLRVEMPRADSEK